MINMTILCENCVGWPGLMGEHGFSVLIERDGRRLLFDTGPGASLPQNTKILGKSLAGIEAILISHGHYDHTGGLKWAIQQTGPVDVFAHPAMFAAHMAKSPIFGGAEPRKVGCPFTESELKQAGARFQWKPQSEEIFPGIWFISGIERRAEYVPQDPQLVLQNGSGGFDIDPIEEDASLLLLTRTDPVLVLGCAHAGVLNILDHVRDRMGFRKLRAVLGGTHLMFFQAEQVERVIERFEAMAVEQVAVSHCTGMRAAIQLGAYFKNRFAVATAGSSFQFD